jgi:hypothetical protein
MSTRYQIPVRRRHGQLPQSGATLEPEKHHRRTTPYQYQRLRGRRSIRILELLPDKQGAPLRCHMWEVNLDDAPIYEAVSYVWGLPNFVKQILCDDEIIPITRSCSYALHHLRREEQSRSLWIDACCIDQHSDHERNHQVGMMGDIYSNSWCTLVWLGKSEAYTSHDDRRALNYISSIGDSVLRGMADDPSCILTSKLIGEHRSGESYDQRLTRLAHKQFV